MVLIGVAGVLSPIMTAWVIVRVAIAVLEERFNGHKALVDARMEANDALVEHAEREINRLRDWRHDEVAPALTVHGGRLKALEHRTDKIESRINP
jgi:hypothetical protein